MMRVINAGKTALGGVIVALAIIGLAVTPDAGKNIGTWIAGLFTADEQGKQRVRIRTDDEVYRVEVSVSARSIDGHSNASSRVVGT